jgi:glycosyltransferase involved in cell wall biosynthesis
MLDAGADEVIVVDYSCPDKVGDWVEAHFPSVRLVRVEDDPGFCLARARNLGAGAATGDLVCFVDADVKINIEWIDWIRARADGNTFFTVAVDGQPSSAELVGTFVCPAGLFRKAGGYDEAFRGWGGEDSDIYARLRSLGARQQQYPSSFLQPIQHQDSDRTRFAAIKKVEDQKLVNNNYIHVKRLFRRQGMDLPLSQRVQLMHQLQDNIGLLKNLRWGQALVVNFADSDNCNRPGFILRKARTWGGLGKPRWKLNAK